MIINDKNLQELNKLLDKIDVDKEETNWRYRRIEKLRIELSRMSKDAKSVQRSENEKRIAEFNRLFIQTLSELSRLLQTTGRSDRDGVAEIVRKIKAK